MECHKCKNKEVKRGRTYRITPLGVRAVYLQEFTCEECGTYVARGNHREGYIYVRDGRIDDNGDDSDITGGYWI